eukprot:CAMPEP_0185025882 /NCGR_PEP_ID=MMETSP1103-20130426/9435_1 /TAXON_ID=36769 /ORGANISM="Paraphysomonas bandaiensis, Strain Caron Lab Isolate" /LENGTH=608 /DNA_ID=CAMNT_0027559261 /DNA_START=416 /DNA_END=2242 /DNA_ORIENTATION=-
MSVVICCEYSRITLIVGGLFCAVLPNLPPLQQRILQFCGCFLVLSLPGYAFLPFLDLIPLWGTVITILLWVGLTGIVLTTIYDIIWSSSVRLGTSLLEVSLSTNIVLKWVIVYSFGYTSWSDTGSDQLLTLLWVDIITCIVCFIYPGRSLHRNITIAKSRLETQKKFVRYVSHEVRTPLNIVFMGIQLMQSHELLQGSSSNARDARVLLNDMQTSCESAVTILNDLLLFDKLREGGMELELKAVDVRKFIRDTVTPLEVQARLGGIDFSFTGINCISPSLEGAYIMADEHKLSQVLRNLVTNALKFTPAGGTVSVKAHRCKMRNKSETAIDPKPFRVIGDCRIAQSEDDSWDAVRIEVHDSGRGLSQEQQKRLFDQYVQFNAAELQSGKGSGLGLYISKMIVQLHHGRIGVISDETSTSGSVFFFELGLIPPTTHTAPDDNKIASPTPTKVVAYSDLESGTDRAAPKTPSDICDTPCSPSLSGGRRFERALVVDDSALNRKMVVRAVSNRFEIVDEACDGVEALSMVKENLQSTPYNIIFMDSVMPNMGGIEATRLLRHELKFTGHVVAVTGNILPDDVEEFKSAGVDKILLKPLKLSDVDDVIKEFL